MVKKFFTAAGRASQPCQQPSGAQDAELYAEEARRFAEQAWIKAARMRVAADKQCHILEEMRETVRQYEALLARKG